MYTYVYVIGINPGGIGEMYYGYPQPNCLESEEYVLLHTRKGFIRLAIQFGVNIIPVYVFGR